MREVRVQDVQEMLANLESWIRVIRESVTVPGSTVISASPHSFPGPRFWGPWCHGLRELEYNDVIAAMMSVQESLHAIREVVGVMAPGHVVGQTDRWDTNCPPPLSA